MTVTVEIRRASARFVERAPGRATHHSFSFGADYDPQLLRFGPMVCHDDHRLVEGQGFPAHPHSGLEIVSWVVSGALSHTDDSGTTVVEPGSVAVLSAGSGVEHAEVAAAPQTRFVQVWLTSEEPEQEPSYVVSRPSLAAGTLVEVARPLPGATFSVARLGAGESVTLPAAPLTHVFLTSGALVRSSLAEPLSAGDAFLMTDEPEHVVTANIPTELLVWSFEA